MATRTFLARNGTDRLVVSTIRTHVIFFHEVGVAFSAERRRGCRWLPSDEAEQPREIRCTFNQGLDPSAFGATPQSGTGFFKLSCDYMALRTHCVDVVRGEPTQSVPNPDNDAHGVRDVLVHFTYDGQEQTLRRSG